MKGSLIENFGYDSTQSLKNCKVYVVNLDRRSDRWNSVQKILNKAGFNNLERISAIDGKQIDTQQVKKLVSQRAFYDLGKERKAHEDLGSLGAVGCYLSHYKIWMKIVESGEPALIAEDDMIMDVNMDNFECVKNSQILNNYDITLLGYSALREKPTQNIINPGLYNYEGMFYGTHFYYLTPHGAEKLLSKSLPMDYQVDSYMGLMIKQQKVKCAFHYPNLSWQSASGTDIQTPMLENSADYPSCSMKGKLAIWVGILVLVLIALSLIFSEK